jgi:murein peptide amidase A
VQRYFSVTPSWKKTALGTAIPLYSSLPLEDLRASQPILLMGGIHGDEPEGVELAEKTLQWLKTQTVDSVAPWILIPCLNVDGFAKNTRVNGRGVDLNRNYPAKNWSANFEKDRYFPGKEPASEPEIQGVVELIKTFNPRLIIHCHSWEPCVVCTGKRGWKDGERLAASCGYQLQEDIGYPTTGSLSQYGWHDHQIPVICIEERDGVKDLTPIWPRFEKGMMEVFRDKGMRK